MKIIIFGASGSGTTTLGKSLAQKLNWPHLDADDYYWKQTEPPFQIKLPLEKRNEWLQSDFKQEDKVIISGSLVTWSSYWNTAFDLGIFLKIPPKIRRERLLHRERERYGAALDHNLEIQEKSKTFLEWASQYDDPTFEGRSISQHRKWIATLDCEVLELIGDLSNQNRLEQVLDKIKGLFL